MFSVVPIKGLFPVPYAQLMSRCAGAGRKHSQADSQAGQGRYSTPQRPCSVYERGLAGGRKGFFSFLIFQELESSLGQEFKLFFSGCESVIGC